MGMRTTGFWGLLTSADQGDLSAIGRTKVYRRGEFLCHEGELATHLFVLVTGSVKIIYDTADGRRRVVALRGNGDVVGELAGETGGERTATVQAIDAVHALIVGYDRFVSFFESHPRAAHAYVHVMIQRWGDAAAKLGMVSVTSGRQRVAVLLLELAERYGNAVDGEIHVGMRLSQEELASLANTSRPVLTRALENWRERGYIRTGVRHITILNSQGLCQAAGQHNLAHRAR
jgi:CRP/FNR family transcriptional regulator, cyclic AMP receptor protein